MAENILVLSAHLGSNRLGQALADAYCKGATEAGATIRYFDLNSLRFETNLLTGDYKGDQPLEPDIEDLQAALLWCDHWTIVHPLWWGGMPGQLKALIDRILQPGFAFSYENGKALPDKLLEGRSARVMITSDTPRWYFNWVYGAGHIKMMRRQILDFVGFSPVRFDLFGPVKSSSEKARRSWLERARRLGLRDGAILPVAKAA